RQAREHAGAGVAPTRTRRAQYRPDGRCRRRGALAAAWREGAHAAAPVLAPLPDWSGLAIAVGWRCRRGVVLPGSAAGVVAEHRTEHADRARAEGAWREPARWYSGRQRTRTVPEGARARSG